MWRITWYSFVYTEHLFDQTGPFIILLDWPFYNSKSSISNRSASSFEKRKDLPLSESIKSSTKMAPGGSRPRRSPRWNLPSVDPVEDELARDPGPVGGPHSGSTSPAPSRNPSPGPELVSALIPAPVPTPVPAPAPLSSDELFKQFMRAYLESNQRLRQLLAEHKQSLKTKVPEMYYGKLHMDCYHFCQQRKDYFETAGATGTNRTLFAAFFLCGNNSVRWTQYKRCYWGEEPTPIIWTEFKAFLRRNLGESKSFVDSIWRKLKRDSQY